MLNSRRPLLHIHLYFLCKAHEQSQIRNFRIRTYSHNDSRGTKHLTLDFGGNDDTIAYYEQRHQRFLEAVKAKSPLKEDEDNITKVADDLTAEPNSYEWKSQVNRRESFRKQTRSLAEKSGDFSTGDEGNKPYPTSREGQSISKPFFDSRFPNARQFRVKPWRLKEKTESQPLDEFPIGAASPSYISLRQPKKSHERKVHDAHACTATTTHEPESKAKGQKEISASPQLSLYEELFPEQVERAKGRSPPAHGKGLELPKLTLPELEEDDDRFENEFVVRRKKSKDLSKSAAIDAYRNWNPAILVLQVASTSLTENDFRRIAPKGQHIRDWVGPGDIFKG